MTWPLLDGAAAAPSDTAEPGLNRAGAITAGVLAGELAVFRRRVLEEAAAALEADGGFEHPYEGRYAAEVVRRLDETDPASAVAPTAAGRRFEPSSTPPRVRLTWDGE